MAPEGEFAELRGRCAQLAIDSSEAAEPWWCNGVESKPDATRRISELLKQARGRVRVRGRARVRVRVGIITLVTLTLTLP